MSAKYKSPSFLLPNELNTSANPLNTDGNPATGTGINSLYSMNFDSASSDYIDAGNPAELQITGALTISYWFKTTNTGYQFIVTKDDGTNSCFDIGLRQQKIYAIIYSSGLTDIETTTTWTDGNWHNVVFVFTPSTSMEIFVDGNSEVIETTGIPASIDNDPANLNIGRRGNNTRYYTGQIDEVAIFNRALDSTEISSLWNNGSPSNLIASNLNPIAYYPLGEQAQMQGYLGDEASSEWQFPNGVLQDYVMDFDGGDNINSEANISSVSSFTASIWINRDDSATQYIYGQWVDGTTASQSWVIQTVGGIVYFNVRNSSLAISSAISTTSLTTGVWYNIIAIWTGSNIKLYINNSLEDTTACSSMNNPSTDVKLAIGSSSNNVSPFNGKISNAVIWNSDQESNKDNIYNNGSPQTTYTVTPQNWWKLNADSVYTPSAPNYTTALDFVASQSDYIDAGNPTSLQITGELSISLWFKTSTTPTASGYLISKGVSPYTSRNFGIWFSSSNTVRAAVNGVSGLVTSPASNYNDDNWHHCVFTFTPSTSTILYIDGSAVATNTTSIPSAINNITSNLEIGKNVSEYFDGEISNVAVYNSALTSSQVSTLFNFGTPETAISFSPISWWKLDNLTTGLLDSGSASNNGTNNGAAEVPSGVAVTPSWKIPTALTIPTINYTTALDFDGSNNLINCGNDSSLAFTSDVSASAWIKTTEPTGAIIGKVYYRFEINNSRISWSVYRTTSIGVFLNSTSIVSDGNWHHIVVTHEAGGNARVYVDGQLEATATANTSILASTQDFFIGRRSATHSRIMDGSISNVQVWNTALTDGGISVGSIAGGQIAELYNNGQPSTTALGSPVSWWKLDTGGSTITDYGSGGNNGTNNGAAKVGSNVYVGNVPVNGVSTTLPSTALQQSDLQFDSPYSNYSLSFDGTGDYIDAGNDVSLQFSSSFTISAWVKIDLNDTGNNAIISKDSSASSGAGYHISFRTGNSVHAWSYDANSKLTATGLTTNTWYHIVFIFESTGGSNGNQSLYINAGTPVTNTITNFAASTIKNLRIGASQVLSGYDTDGKIDETALWSTALTSAQVLEIYNNGRPKDLTTFSGTAPISWWRLGENAYFDNNSFIVPNSISGAPNGTGSGTVTTMISADAPGTYANGIGTDLDILDRVGDAPLSTSNSQSYNMIPSDISPYVPQYVGNQISNTYSMTFDGINDYFNVGIPNFLSAKSTFTISLWFNTDDISSQTTLCMVGSSAGQLWGLSKFQDDLIIYGGSSTNYYRKNTLFNINTWYNLIVVYDGSQSSANRYKAYVNGSLLTSPTIYGTIDTITPTFTTDFNIGRIDYAAAGYFKGSIDEVAIWDTALNAGQIYNDIYQPTATGTNQTADLVNNPNLPNPVAWYRMGD